MFEIGIYYKLANEYSDVEMSVFVIGFKKT